MKTGIKISKLIPQLEAIKKRDGDLEVWLSTDEEGNSFSPFLWEDYSIGIEKGRLILYPSGAYLAEEVFGD